VAARQGQRRPITDPRSINQQNTFMTEMQPFRWQTQINPWLRGFGLFALVVVSVLCCNFGIRSNGWIERSDALLVFSATCSLAYVLLAATRKPLKRTVQRNRLRMRAIGYFSIFIASLSNCALNLFAFPNGTAPSFESLTLLGIIIPAGTAVILAFKELSESS
jgi:hypothetical protein